MTTILTLKKLRQGDHEFKGNLGYHIQQKKRKEGVSGRDENNRGNKERRMEVEKL